MIPAIICIAVALLIEAVDRQARAIARTRAILDMEDHV
jgi:hypothetical protein